MYSCIETATKEFKMSIEFWAFLPINFKLDKMSLTTRIDVYLISFEKYDNAEVMHLNDHIRGNKAPPPTFYAVQNSVSINHAIF